MGPLNKSDKEIRTKYFLIIVIKIFSFYLMVLILVHF